MEYFRFEFCLFCFDFCFVFSAVLFSNFTNCCLHFVLWKDLQSIAKSFMCLVFIFSGIFCLTAVYWEMWKIHFMIATSKPAAYRVGYKKRKWPMKMRARKTVTKICDICCQTAKRREGARRGEKRRERGREEEAFWQCIKYAPVWPVHRGSPEDIRWHSPHHHRLLRQPLQLLLLLHLLRLPHPAVPYKRALWHWAESIKAGKTTLWLSSFCNGTKSETTTASASAKYIAPKNNCMKNQRAHELAD